MSDKAKLHEYTTPNDPSIKFIRYIVIDESPNNICITLGASLFRTFIIYKKIPMNHISTSISNRLKHYTETLNLEPYLLSNILALIKHFEEAQSASIALKNLNEAIFGDYTNIISGFIEKVLEKELYNATNLLNTSFDLNNAEKIFGTFANCFLVNIQLVNKTDVKLSWFPDRVGVCPVITIVFDNITLYWAFSDYLLSIENGETLNENIITTFPFVAHVSSHHQDNDNLFLQENIMDMPSLDITDKGMSKRTHISKLPLANDTILELKLEYCHCHAVKNKYNQINSFAIALYYTLKRPSLKDFKKNLCEKFLHQQTFTNLVLPLSKDFRGQRSVRFLKLVKEVLVHAWANTSQIYGFNEIPDGELGDVVNELATDLVVIHILSVVFGVTSVVIAEDHRNPGKFERCIFNSSENVIPSLHFIAISKYGLYQTYVLITVKHQYEIAYDLLAEKSTTTREMKIKEIINENQRNQINQRNQEMPEVQNDSTIDFLHETCKVQSAVLNSIKDQISKYQRIKIDEGFVLNEVGKLKNLRDQLRENERFNETLLAIEVPKSYKQGCHYCGEADDLISMNSNGCAFHKNCIIGIFQAWLNEQYSFAGKIKNQSFACPRCIEPIRLSCYLDYIADEYTISFCRERFNKKFICANCKGKNPMESLYLHSRECAIKICIPCVVGFTFNNIQNNCPGCNYPLFVDLQTTFSCEFCRHTTTLSNFVKVFNEKKQIACKKCWYQIVQELLHFSDDPLILNQGNEELKNEISVCTGCNIQQYKNYSNYSCLNGCWLCSKCIFERPDMSCKNCGEQILKSNIYTKDPTI